VGDAVAPEIAATDYHTAGEPFRIVTAGVPPIAGATVRERRERAAASEPLETVRRLLCHEPRGHADMYGCFLVAPDDDGADLGVLFWHKDGYSTACGHGTIALGAWAVESGAVAGPRDGEVDVTIDVPSGRVVARVRLRDGVVEAVAFRNVPSFVIARDVQAAGVAVDVSYGGAIYASVPAARFGLRVVPDDLPALIAAGRAIKQALEGTPVARHPDDERLSGLYGTILYDDLGPLHQRNVTIFADGEVDRSPCGSGTSARCALLAADGLLGAGDVLRHDSIVGSTFTARVVGSAAKGVLTEVEGMAYRTGEHRFVLDPRDPLGTGFVLR
jgi:proline racemase/trans-L-3-hydroxyproline dehydratase